MFDVPNRYSSLDAFLNTKMLDEGIDYFTAPRKIRGFYYQTTSIRDDLAAGKRQSDIMPLSASLEFQLQIDQIKQLL